MKDEEPVRRLVNMYSKLSNTTIEDGAQLSNIMEGFRKVTTEGRRKMTEASAAFSREGEVPWMLRETDVNKLAFRWITQTLKHAFIKDDLNKLNTYLFNFNF
jgi:hypothetical protein